MTADSVATIRASGLFDADDYGRQANLPAADVNELIRHYLRTGERAGLMPNPAFDPSWYARQGGREAALLDYIARAEAAPDPHPLFDQAYYLGQMRAAGLTLAGHRTPLAHYLSADPGEGLDPHPLFSHAHYLANNPDVRDRGYNPLRHYLTHGAKELRSPCPEFDPAFYVRNNPDVARAGLNPLQHYVTSGGREGRDPSAAFDSRWYLRLLQMEPNRQDTPNPLVHYVQHGKRMGYPPRARLFALDERDTLDTAEFDIFVRGLHLALRSLPVPAPGVRRMIVCHEDPASDAEVHLDALDGRLAGLGEHERRRCAVLFVPAGHALLPEAVEAFAHAFRAGMCLLTADSVCFEQDRAAPLLLPGRNPAYLRHAARIPPFAADAGFCHAQKRENGEDLSAWFRRLAECAAATDPGALRHLPIPVTAAPPEHRGGVPAIVSQTAAIVCAPRQTATLPETSVIICTKDCGHLLAQLVSQLVQPAMHGIREVLIVTNQPGNAFARAYHAELAALDRVRLIDYPRDYNFSDQCNVGALQARGSQLLFLNDDVAPIGVNWLREMLGSMADSGVAVVGPLLLYPDETIQHGGMFLGYNNVAGHCLRGRKLPLHESSRGLVPSDCSCVTGAVMLVRADVFAELGGFDYSLATYLQDVDFCLRVRRSGHRIVFNPRAMLFHMESVSAAKILRENSVMERRGREYQRFAQRWGDAVYDDRTHNPNWAKHDERLATLVSLDPAVLRAHLYE